MPPTNTKAKMAPKLAAQFPGYILEHNGFNCRHVTQRRAERCRRGVVGRCCTRRIKCRDPISGKWRGPTAL